jgi:hypothetical protein
MKTFTYKNNKKNGEVMFVCQAEDLLAADKIFLEKTGFDVIKCPWIGCIIE